MKLAIGMLVFNRPIHTALSLAYAMVGKSEFTELHVFYSIHRYTTAPSKALDKMLKELSQHHLIQLHYLHENLPQNCGGNVDTLMHTLTSLEHLDCFIKIDDDVLIGKSTDALMANLLLDLEKDGVLLLMGQAVPQHMRNRHPFAWEKSYGGYKIVQRAHKACPMETYTAVNPKFMHILKQNGKSSGCENDKGTFMPYTRKITIGQYKSALVLNPAIQMQHIGLTSTIDRDAVRGWAPAVDWNTETVIAMPHFDFSEWELSHKKQTQKGFTLDVLRKLKADYPKCHGLDMLIRNIEKYSPGSDDVPLPKDPIRPVNAKVLSRADVVEQQRARRNRVIKQPQVIKRVVIKPARTVR